MLRGDDLTRERIAAEVEALRDAIGAGLDEAEAEATYELRYRGQAFELRDRRPRPAGSRRAGRGASPPSTSDATATAIPRPRSSWSTSGSRSTVRGAVPEPGRPPIRGARAAQRRARFAGEWRQTDACCVGEPAGRTRGRGPLRLRAARGDAGATAGLARATSTSHGTIDAERAMSDRLDPVTLQVLGRGAARGLRRDGRGPDARGALGEHQGAPRLLDRALRRAGELVMQAEHIPVHLGLDAGRGGGRARLRAARRATSGSSTTPTAAARTCPTSR